VDDILKCAERFAFIPTYIVCSGDIAETGTADQFKEAHHEVSQIAAGLSVDKSNVLFVPGNHDINRDLSSLSAKIGESRLKLQCYDKICRNFYGDSRNLDTQTFQVICDYRLGILFVLINSCEKEDHDIHVGSVCLQKLNDTIQGEEVRFAMDQGFLMIAVIHHRVDSDGGEAKFYTRSGQHHTRALSTILLSSL